MSESASEQEDDYSWLAAPLLGWKSFVFWTIIIVVAAGVVIAIANLPIISGTVPA